MPDRRRSWFALEVLFLLGLAAGLALAKLPSLEIAGVMVLGWVIVALLEWAAWRGEPHYGSGLPPRYYVPGLNLPPPQPLEQVATGYPEAARDEAPTWIASAALRQEMLGEWPVAGAAAGAEREPDGEVVDPWLVVGLPAAPLGELEDELGTGAGANRSRSWPRSQNPSRSPSQNPSRPDLLPAALQVQGHRRRARPVVPRRCALQPRSARRAPGASPVRPRRRRARAHDRSAGAAGGRAGAAHAHGAALLAHAARLAGLPHETAARGTRGRARRARAARGGRRGRRHPAHPSTKSTEPQPEGSYVALAGSSGPAAFGRQTACGGVLHPDTEGVAHPTLPCGARIFLRYNGTRVLTQVVDRGPYVAGRQFDLTDALARRVGLRGVQPIRWAYARAG